MSPNARNRIPTWLKAAYTAFIAILIPVYLRNYGATNFLYFCDVAAFVTLVGIWLESPRVLSAALVGIFLPQVLWMADFAVELCGGRLVGMTSYMFQPPFFLRLISFFHVWLPLLLLWLVARVGYDRRGIVLWSAIAWVVLTICYVWLPGPSLAKDPVTGFELRHPDHPVNVNFVHNIASDDYPQQWMDSDVYFALYAGFLVVGVYLPMHWLCRLLMPQADEKSAWGIVRRRTDLGDGKAAGPPSSNAKAESLEV